MSKEKYTDLVWSSDENLALINGLSIRFSPIVNLNIDTSFVGIVALSVEMLTLKLKFASMCQH